MKGANLVSRTSEMMNKNKAQGVIVKEEIVTVDAPAAMPKDELKKV